MIYLADVKKQPMSKDIPRVSNNIILTEFSAFMYTKSWNLTSSLQNMFLYEL
jgi:hypothetical protein